MRIEELEWLQVGRWFYLLVHTEEGITGLGEGGVHGYPEAIGGVLQAWRPYLLGKDPLRIEHHWQVLYRNAHFRGAVIGSALSALDIALWDVTGKHFGAPAYQLLGGRCRDRVRLYMHVAMKRRALAPPDALAADLSRPAGLPFSSFLCLPRESGLSGRRYRDGGVCREAMPSIGAGFHLDNGNLAWLARLLRRRHREWATRRSHTCRARRQEPGAYRRPSGWKRPAGRPSARPFRRPE
jgi:hypothetical protein